MVLSVAIRYSVSFQSAYALFYAITLRLLAAVRHGVGGKVN